MRQKIPFLCKVHTSKTCVAGNVFENMLFIKLWSLISLKFNIVTTKISRSRSENKTFSNKYFV